MSKSTQLATLMVAVVLLSSLSSRVNASSVSYVHTNHQGSVVEITNEQGNVVESERYYAYGEERYSDGDSSERKYTGQIKDSEDNLYYYNARYYDPTLSLFISPDYVNDQANRYTYVRNNPVMLVDPSGERIIDVLPHTEYGLPWWSLSDQGQQTTYAGVYGNIGAWGTLGTVNNAQDAAFEAIEYASAVDSWDNSSVTPLVNLNINSESPELIEQTIIECANRCIVMLDLALFEGVDVYTEIVKWTKMGSHVWFDIDLEWSQGGISAQQLNELSSLYFETRSSFGYEDIGVFGFYDFLTSPSVSSVEDIKWSYENGYVVPIFDGFGSTDFKYAQTEVFLNNYEGAEYFGLMEANTLWGNEYDTGLDVREYFEKFQPFIYISQ